MRTVMLRSPSRLLLVVLGALLPGAPWASRLIHPEDSHHPHAIGHHRDERISLFNVVTFQNDPCTAGADLTGTCLSSTECSDAGGSASGNCAAGFGVCCVFTATCGATVTQNCTYLQNPSYPNEDTAFNTCAFTIRKCSSDVCTYRIDFETGDLSDPATGAAITDITLFGDCLDGGVAFDSGSGRDPAMLCGDLTGQHIFLEAGAGDVTSMLTFTGGGTFRFKVNQLDCKNSPPKGCEQYFTGVEGTIKSYNFNGGYHLNSQDYTICIRPEDGYCEISYTSENGDAGFGLTGNDAARTGNECSRDFIEIQDARNIYFPENSELCMTSDLTGMAGEPASSSDRFCGNTLSCVRNDLVPRTIISTDFMVDFVTDPDELNTATDPRQGICLNYKQLPCEC